MGCFSWLSVKNKRPATSDSARGSRVHIFFIYEGKLLEYMYGNYDSYGRVFAHKYLSSLEWYHDWGNMVDAHYNNDKHTGFALLHEHEWKKGDPIPETISESDGNQGWGDEYHWEHIENPSHILHDVVDELL